MQGGSGGRGGLAATSIGTGSFDFAQDEASFPPAYQWSISIPPRPERSRHSRRRLAAAPRGDGTLVAARSQFPHALKMSEEAEGMLRSGRADGGEELVDLDAQGFGLAAELAGGGEDLGGGCPGIAGGLVDPSDVARDRLGAARGLLGAARDLAGRRALLLDRGGDRRRDLPHLADRSVDPLDRLDRTLGRRLDRRDLAGDLLGRLAGLIGQRLDLRGDDGKALAGLARARRLDGGVQGKEIRLRGDVLDHL